MPRCALALCSCCLAWFTLWGCATSGNPAVLNEQVLAQILIGTSTKDDVRRLLGEPNMVLQSSGQSGGLPQPTNVEMWSYAYMNIATSPVTFVPIVGLFAGSTNVESGSVAIGFDRDGIVRHITKGRNKTVGGPGAQ